MWKNNRPDGWGNKNPCDDCEARDIPNRVCDMTCIRLCKYESIEAGADAYEKAIWKLAKESPTGTFTFDTQFYRGVE